jgi:hypothetical protein
MKKTWLYLLIAAFLFCLAAAATLLTGSPQYVSWFILVLILSPLIWVVNVGRPRRGMHYTYWNRYVYVFGSLALIMAGVPLAVGYFTTRSGLSADMFFIFLVAWGISFPVGFLLWFKFRFLPTWGPWRLRKRYPQMMTAAHQFKKLGESYTWYFPLIIMRGKPYLVVGYNAEKLVGIATLDEQGNFVKDEALAMTLIRCYKLALSVVHMPDSRTRAKDIDSFKQMDQKMQRAFQYLRANEEYFRMAGQPAHDLWESICNFEPDFHAILKIWIERKTWQVQWAVEQGLNKLTEISNEQLRAVEARLQEFNLLLLNYTARLDQAGADAEVLLRTCQQVKGTSSQLQQRALVEEMLKALVVLRQGAVVWEKTVTDYLPLGDEWQAWKARRAIAEKLEQER